MKQVDARVSILSVVWYYVPIRKIPISALDGSEPSKLIFRLLFTYTKLHSTLINDSFFLHARPGERKEKDAYRFEFLINVSETLDRDEYKFKKREQTQQKLSKINYTVDTVGKVSWVEILALFF